MLKQIFKDRNFLTIFLTIFIFWIIFILSFFGIFYSIDKKFQNFSYKIIDSDVSEDLIIVEIDDITLEKLWYPLDRKFYVPFIENLTNAWVPIIAFDIIFSDKSNFDLSDNLFAQSIKKSKNVIFWLALSNDNNLLKTYKLFKDYIINSWYLTSNIDIKTNTIYSIIPMTTFSNWELKEHFAISILKSYYSFIYWKDYTSNYWIEGNIYHLTPDLKIPLSRFWNFDYKVWKNQEKEILINYANRDNFNTISFYDIYNEANFKEIKEHIDFKDKIVLVWFTAKWVKDIYTTPNWSEYWVYIHANFINTILTKSFLVYFNKSFEWILILLLIIVSVYFNLSRSWFILFLSNFIIILIFTILFPFMVIIFTNLIINYPAELIFSLLISLSLANIVKYVFESKEKIKLNQALSEYVSADIAHEILYSSWKINLNWEEKRISIFFSDIEWFTSISEKLTPDQLVWFLRTYLSKMSDVILDEDWFINKYEWDSIMSIWWIFWTYKDKISYKACISALKQQNLLYNLNKQWINVFNKWINVRMWIHTWKAIIWNIWSIWKKIEFTALWNSVNLASRLEGVNKYYGTNICVSEDVYLDVKDDFDFRYLDEIKVKWKDIWVKIYELISEKEKTNIKQNDIIDKFSQAMELYQNRKFEEASIIFKNLKISWDKPSLVYFDRCKKYIKNPPWDDWDWIWVMESK